MTVEQKLERLEQLILILVERQQPGQSFHRTRSTASCVMPLQFEEGFLLGPAPLIRGPQIVDGQLAQ